MPAAETSWAGSRVGLLWDTGVGASGKTPGRYRCCVLAELPSPLGTGRGAPSLRRLGVEKAGADWA